MKRLVFTVALISLCFIGLIRISHTSDHESRPEKGGAVNDLRNTMKRLWEDHTIAMHTYIVSVFTDDKDKEKILENLLANCDDLGDVIKKYYGDEKGADFTFLLKEHVSIAEEVMTDIRESKYSALKKDQESWNKNADQIASLLHSVNPQFPEQHAKDMLYQHMDFTTDVIMSRFNQRLSDEMRASDNDHEQVLKIADLLTDEIAKQFPDRFGK